MKLLYAGICLILLSFSTLTQPSSILTLYGGYNLPIGDLKGEYNDSLSRFKSGEDENSYFVKNGYAMGLNIKFSMNRQKTIKVYADLHYNTFQSNKSYINEDVNIKVQNRIYILTISPGIEYMWITKKSKINPFVGGGFTINLFSGNEEVNYTDSLDKIVLDPEMRIGISVNTGLDIKMSTRLGLQTGVSYNIANLFGKSFNGTTYALNDEEYIINNKRYESRVIQFLTFFAGFSLYLGI